MVQFLSVVSTLFYCKTLSLTAVNVYELEARMILARFILWFSLDSTSEINESVLFAPSKFCVVVYIA